MNQISKFLIILFINFPIVEGIAFSQTLPGFIDATAQSFTQIQQQANAYFALHPELKKGKEDREENPYVQYKRWEWYWQNRLMPDGTFPEPTTTWEMYKNLQAKKTRSNTWKNISQTTAISGYDGMGRVTSIAFHPTDSNIFYVAAPKGGLWKTLDGGNTYNAVGDNLPTVACGDVVIDPIFSNTLYVALNDRYGWWNYTIGIYKSTDDGATWHPTGLTHAYADGKTIYDLAIHPTNGQIVFSAENDGLYRTADSGATWSKVLNKGVSYILPKPGNPNIWYAASYDYWNQSQVYISLDAGVTWNQQSSFVYSQNWITLATTSADTNYLAITHSTNKELWESNDGGNTINFKSIIPVNEVFQISGINKNIMYTGELDVYKSTDAGMNWIRITKWYDNQIDDVVHADQRSGAVHPITNKIFWCNDGGLYRYNEKNMSWKDLSNGLLITQFYKIDVAQTDTVFMIGGTQDNGGRKRVAIGQWDAINGGDAMQVAIDPTNEQLIYSTYVNGEMYRSGDQWTNDTYHEITPDKNDYGSWVTPYQIDPKNANALVAGYTDVYKSTDNGDNWTKISNNLAGPTNDDNLKVLAVAPSNTDVIYAGKDQKMFITKNLGTTWSTKNLPSSNGSFEEISSIAVHPKNDKVLWFTKSGYSTNRQVWKSIDGGNTFKNHTFNLPNLPANCIMIDKESDSANVDMYVGTDAGGVFYKKDMDTTWQYYSAGLPNTEVTDLKIQYATGKLVVATYGRGIWETQIVRKIAALAVANVNVKSKEIISVANAQNKWVVTVNAANSQLTNYRIVDANGKLLLQEPIQLKTGENNFVIANNALMSGIYFIAIENKFGNTLVEKIMVQ